MDQETINGINDDLKVVDNFNNRLFSRYIKKGEVYKALCYAEERHGVPIYIVLRRCDIDWRYYNRALYGYTDLTDQEIEKILDDVKETFGIK